MFYQPLLNVSQQDLLQFQKLRFLISWALYRFFAPSLTAGLAPGFDKDSLSEDGALSAYAETVIWRLKCAHAMVS
jgi:hypothetical protein